MWKNIHLWTMTALFMLMCHAPVALAECNACVEDCGKISQRFDKLVSDYSTSLTRQLAESARNTYQLLGTACANIEEMEAASASNDVALGMGNSYVATSQALANAAHNATSNMEATNRSAQDTMERGVIELYLVDTSILDPDDVRSWSLERMSSYLKACVEELQARLDQLAPEFNTD